MLSILILLLFVVIVLFLSRKSKEFPVVVVICIFLFIIGTSCLLCIPFAGYNDEPVVEETHLVPIFEGGEADYYLINSEEHYYTFKTREAPNKYGVAEENLTTMSGTNIQYFEEDNRSIGLVKKYTYEPKRNLFVLALDAEIVEYAFILPSGSVIE